MRSSLVKLHFALAFLFLLSVPAAAQFFPLPGSDKQAPVKCNGCRGSNIHQQPNEGLNTYPYAAPIVKHVGRLVESTSTQHYQGPGFRTGRGGKIMTMRSQRGSAPPRAYVRIGEAIFAWRLDTFFASALPGGMKPVGAYASSVSKRAPAAPPYENILLPEAYCYPEHSSESGGWVTRAGDVQNTFGDMDFDDRGYIYAAMKDHGWGVVKDGGETGGATFQLVSPQFVGVPLIPQAIMVMKSGAKYYVAISDANAGAVALFDATSPATTVPLRSDNQGYAIPRQGAQWGIRVWAKNTSGDHIAYVGGDNKLYIFEPGDYIAGGSPIKTLTPSAGRKFRDIDYDESGNLWIAEGIESAPVTNVLRRLTPSGAGYTESTPFNVYGEAFSPQKIHVSDGHIALSGWGIGSDGSGSIDVKVYKIEGASALREIGFNKFFSKYYHRAPLGYAQPQVYPNTYTSSPNDGDVHIIKWQGKLYLMYNAWGIGDVYELESGGSINGSIKGNKFGTTNPHSKGTGGPFLGDIVTFNGSSSVPGSGGLIWDFGNPEAGTSANTGASANGADVEHQYTNITTAANITKARVVTIYEGNDQTITTTLPIALKVPEGRIGLPDGTALTGTTTGAALVFGESLTDASDGSVESHFVNWSVDGIPVKQLPGTPVAAGAIGQHTVTHTASYGKYDLTSFLPVGSQYTTAPVSLTYDVRPFVFSFKNPTKGTSSVTFGATARKTSSNVIMTATQWTATWSLKKNGADVVPQQVSTVNATANVPNFVVQGNIPDGSELSLTLEVALTGLALEAQQYASYTQSMILDAPDPKITKTANTCVNALAPCSFTAGSVAGKAMADWTLSWTLLKGNATVASGNSTTFSPDIATEGLYTVKLTATKSIFTTTVQQDINVAKAICGSPVPADNVTIWASCTVNCTANTDISFRPDLFQYTPQDCDQWFWDFGDGTTGSTTGSNIFIKHKYANNRAYTVKLTAKNGAGQTVVTPITVRVGTDSGGGGGGNTCTAVSTASFTYTGSKGCGPGVDCKVGEFVTFTPKKNNGNLTSCDSASWNFGDGDTSNSKGPSHTFDTQGNYEVTLTLTNSATDDPVTTKQTIKVVPDVSNSCSRAVTNVDFYLFYLGRQSGCSDSNNKLCTPGETIDFKALPFFGYTFQTCDKFQWTFGDGTGSAAKEIDHIFPANDNTFEVSLRVYNTLGEGTLTLPVRFAGPSAEPPPVLTANFPDTGGKGTTITFTVDSNMPTTTGWTWNFGDGTGNITSQAGAVGQSNTMTHTFANAGTYDVTVSARNSKAASTALTAVATDRIVISDIPMYTFLLPAVIHDDGQNASKWRTDVQVYYGAPNPAAEPLVMTASFAGQNTPLSINQSTFIYEDFMARLTTAKAQGPVVITTQAKYKPQIWTRTYNVDPSGKTYGQFIPAVELTSSTAGTVDGLADPNRYYLSGLRQDSRYRTNIGLINTTTSDVIADITAYDDLMTPLDHFTETLTPFALKQFSLSRVANLSNRPISLQITVPAGKRMVGYASFIDGRSNDPVYISATSELELSSPAFATSITPGVGHVGAWRSDVTIFNPDDRNSVTFDLEYYDGSGLRRGLATNLSLGPLQAKNYEDLLKVPGLFTNVPDGVGMLKLTTTSQQTKYPLTFSRTYNDKGSGGTFGQGIPGVAASLANVKVGKGAIIAGVRSSANYKTNIGLTNTTANAVNVRVQLLDPNTGAVAREESYSLAGYASVVGEYPFGSIATGALKIEITSGDGAVWAFASVIDRLSEDPEYVPAQAMQ